MGKINRNKEKVEILKEEYEQLIEDSLLLTALRDLGVDNWSGYAEALELFKEYKEC